jgi:hypothetical protein
MNIIHADEIYTATQVLLSFALSDTNPSRIVGFHGRRS